MSFVYPWVLAAGCLALVAIGWLGVRSERLRRDALARFGERDVLGRSSSIPSSRQSARVRTLRLAALGLGVLALARPQAGERQSDMVRTGRDVLLLLDLSRSMGVADIATRGVSGPRTRLAAAKQLAWDVTSAYPGDRVGLVVFGGSAFLQLPLTSDRASLRLFLDAASPDDLGDPATDVSAALLTAVSAFEHEGETGRRAVVIVTDGESGEGDLDAAAEALRGEELPLFAIGVGSAQGGPVPADSAEAPERYHRDHIGRVVISRLEEGDLRRVAQASGGGFARWDRPDEIRALVAGLGQVRARTLGARTSSERADRYQWPLGLMVVLLAFAEMPATVTLSRRRRGRSSRAVPSPSPAAQGDKVAVASGLFLLVLSNLSCSPAHRGERLYHQGKYPAAYEVFRGGLQRDSSARLTFDAGSTLYRLERYDEAAAAFRRSRRAPELRQRSLYNLGNALVRVAEERPGEPEPLLDAAAAFEEALSLAPGDAEARWNLEVALRRLGDDRTSGGSSGRGRAGDYGRGDNNVPGYEGNPDAAVGAMAGGGYGSAEGESVEELSPDEARRLLEAVERQQLTSHEGRRGKRGPTGERDW
ncbi:MAG: VWA domain-containing protein [Gemmatimonadales bacterium]|nr:VWA domain-containing protein [Gemmatimonadales bacterium]